MHAVIWLQQEKNFLFPPLDIDYVQNLLTQISVTIE